MSTRQGIPAHLQQRWLSDARRACKLPRGQQTRRELASCVSRHVQASREEHVSALRARMPAEKRGCPPPSPLAQALAAGEKVRVERRGRSSCAITVPDGVLAYYRSCDNAQKAIQRARCSLPAAGGTSSRPAAERQQTSIFTPQKKKGDPARYVVMESDDVIASHEPMSFTPDPRYPDAVQERLYHADRNEQIKVTMGGQNLVPRIVINTAPTATDGPPMLTEDGCALGGNGRAMMIKRAYAEGGDSARAYRQELEEHAAEFGLDPEQVRRMRKPILVRVVEGLRCDTERRELVKAVRRYNEGLTNAMDTRAKAVGQARQLSAGTISLFGEILANEGSLREHMEENGRVFLRALESDGIITGENRSAYMTKEGKLTPRAKDEIEAMFLGLALGSADRIDATSPAVLRKIEKAVPSLTMVAARSPEFDLTGTLIEAVDLLNAAQGAGTSLEGYIARGKELPLGDRHERPQPGHEALQLARMLEQHGQNNVRDRFKAWARDAAEGTSGGLFGKPPTPAEAFDALVAGTKIGKERPIFTGTTVRQPRPGNPRTFDLARVVTVGDGKPKRDGGTGIDVGEFVIEYLTGARQGERQKASRASLGETVS